MPKVQRWEQLRMYRGSIPRAVFRVHARECSANGPVALSTTAPAWTMSAHGVCSPVSESSSQSHSSQHLHLYRVPLVESDVRVRDEVHVEAVLAGLVGREEGQRGVARAALEVHALERK